MTKSEAKNLIEAIKWFNSDEPHGWEMGINILLEMVRKHNRKHQNDV